MDTQKLLRRIKDSVLAFSPLLFFTCLVLISGLLWGEVVNTLEKPAQNSGDSEGIISRLTLDETGTIYGVGGYRPDSTNMAKVWDDHLFSEPENKTRAHIPKIKPRLSGTGLPALFRKRNFACYGL